MDNAIGQCRGASWRVFLRRYLSHGLASCVLTLACLPIPAHAQSGSGEWVAHIQGNGTYSIPAGTAIAVLAQDFDDVNTRLQPVIEQALAGGGYRVEAGAELQLIYDTELFNATMGAQSDEPATDTEVGDMSEDNAMDVEGRDTGPHPAEFEGVAPQVTVPIGRSANSETSRYALTFVVGAPGQTPVWNGGVNAELPPQDPYPVVLAMVPLLVPQIGKTMSADHAFPR